MNNNITKFIIILLLFNCNYLALNAQCKFLNSKQIIEVFNNRNDEDFFLGLGFDKINITSSNGETNFGRCREYICRESENYREFIHTYAEEISYEFTDKTLYLNMKMIAKSKYKFVGIKIIAQNKKFCYYDGKYYYIFV